MKRIRLELARDHEFPEGSRDRGYEFAAPLDEKGHLLADEWRTMRERCRVKRFWSGQKDELGHLVHRRGGSWAFDYDIKRTDDDEPGFKFDRHHFIPGWHHADLPGHLGPGPLICIKACISLEPKLTREKAYRWRKRHARAKAEQQ